MSTNELHIPVLTKSGEIFLDIYGESLDSISTISEADAEVNGESKYQIKEGHSYEFKISNKSFTLRSEIKDIVKQSIYEPSTGRLTPNIFVGTMILEICRENTSENYLIRLEVISVKTDYRNDYRFMLEEITEKCTDIIMQHTSPIVQNFEPDFERNPRTYYQQFAFIKSILDSDEFNDSVQKIISNPVTSWKESESDRNIHCVKRLNNNALNQIAKSSNRVPLPSGHYLKSKIQSIPARIKINEKSETVDTPENRFIKYVLYSFSTVCGILSKKLSENSRARSEATRSAELLDQYLSHSIFKGISHPDTLPLNSPILQRKEGYREILKVWLMFNLAAKLIWSGGEDVYNAGKRDVAVLYEYWLFFKLLDIIKEVFDVNSKSIEELITPTEDGLGLKLKQGKHIAVKGIYKGKSRKLNIEFSYNRTYSGDKTYPLGGSWTKNMRPDYTLTIWPFDIPNQCDAEMEELIVHIHFDAKYKIENLRSVFIDEANLDDEKIDQKNGKFKRIDLLKMHSYRDAIRRTGGAYILYPGCQTFQKSGYHEIIPGLGAFPIRPSKIDTGEGEIKLFVMDVVKHFMNRASQREKLAYRVYDIHKNEKPNQLREIIPEAYGINRALLPDDTYVLIGFYKSPEHHKWITSNSLYNFRTGSGRGSLILDKEIVNAKYLLLHTYGDDTSGDIWQIISRGPKIYSKNELTKRGYPSPSQDYYLVIEIERITTKDFENLKWEFKKLKNYSSGLKSPLPFTASLTEFMNAMLP